VRWGGVVRVKNTPDRGGAPPTKGGGCPPPPHGSRMRAQWEKIEGQNAPNRVTLRTRLRHEQLRPLLTSTQARSSDALHQECFGQRCALEQSEAPAHLATFSCSRCKCRTSQVCFVALRNLVTPGRADLGLFSGPRRPGQRCRRRGRCPRKTASPPLHEYRPTIILLNDKVCREAVEQPGEKWTWNRPSTSPLARFLRKPGWPSRRSATTSGSA